MFPGARNARSSISCRRVFLAALQFAYHIFVSFLMLAWWLLGDVVCGFALHIVESIAKPPWIDGRNIGLGVNLDASCGHWQVSLPI